MQKYFTINNLITCAFNITELEILQGKILSLLHASSPEIKCHLTFSLDVNTSIQTSEITCEILT